MKMMKRFSALALAIVMMLAMTVTVFAKQDVGTGNNNPAKITINNAAIGETYKVYKLFGAKVTGAEEGAISYTGTIPSGMESFFAYENGQNDTNGIKVLPAAGTDNALSTGYIAALNNWIKSAQPVTWKVPDAENPGQTKTISEVVATDNVVEFSGLEYGYYVVHTTQGQSVLTVTNTNPNASIYDKNVTEPTVDPTEGKKVQGTDKVFYIGETVTYDLTFTTANYAGSGNTAKKINSYIIEDTLPEFLSDVTVTSIKIDNVEYTVNGVTPQFTRENSNGTGKGTITIPWTDATGKSLYKNNASVVVTYTAKVTDKAVIAGGGNLNKFTLKYVTDDPSNPENPSKGESTETIKTYAIVIKKIDGKGNPLKDAEFSVSGLQAKTTSEKGVYFVNGKTSAGGTDTVMKTDENGILILKGVDNAQYAVTEVTAPSGYNKLQNPVNVTAQELSTTSTTKYWSIDADGNYTESEQKAEGGFEYTNNQLAATVLPIVNMKGSILPSTGGIGTTIFYVVGGILVAVAVVLLVTKKRMSNRA